MTAAEKLKRQFFVRVVPCFVHGPSRVRSGLRTRSLFSVVDVYATIKDLIGAKIPARFPREESVSHADFLLGKTNDPPRKWMFAYNKGRKLLRDATYVYDGRPTLWDCSSSPDERLCTKVEDPALKAKYAQLMSDIEASNGTLDATVDPAALA